MKNSLPASIIFDLDGTLVNTVPDVRLALNHALKVYGHAAMSAEEIYSYIGKGAKYMLVNAFAKYDHQLSKSELEKVLDDYLVYYLEHPVVETIVYPGVPETLTDFSQAGVALGICTNKPGVVTRLVLQSLNLSRFFSAVVCGDETSEPKPAANHLFEVLTKMQVDAKNTVLVGDSLVDQQCAQNAEIPFVGVTYGYDLDKSAHGRLVHHFSELPGALHLLQKEVNVS